MQNYVHERGAHPELKRGVETREEKFRSHYSLTCMLTMYVYVSIPNNGSLTEYFNTHPFSLNLYFMQEENNLNGQKRLFERPWKSSKSLVPVSTYYVLVLHFFLL